MSTQSLRELLESELAALSDCDEDDSIDDEVEYGTKGLSKIDRILEAPKSDVDDGDNILSSLDEWRLLMESSEQAERRLQNMELSFNNCLRDETEPLAVASIRSTAEDSFVVDLDRFPDSHPADDVIFAGGRQVISGVTPTNDNQQDHDIIRKELLDLMHCMIEAVERSAPIIRAQALKPVMTRIDWSQLPHVIGEDDIIEEDNASSGIANLVNSITQVAPYIDATSYSSGDVERTKRSTEMQEQLKTAEDNLLLDADSAQEKAMQLRKRLHDKKLRMEDELGALKRDQSSILIQSKWRQHQRRGTLSRLRSEARRVEEDQLESSRLAMKVQLAAEEEERKRQNFRLQLQEDEAKRIAAEENRLQVEELQRLEEAAAVQREIAVQLELDRSRELSEAGLMQSMESQSRLAWEYEMEFDTSCVLCPECSVRIKHEKKPRRRKHRRSQSTAKIKFPLDGDHQPVRAAVLLKSRLEIEQGIAILVDHWQGKVADQLSRPRCLQAVFEPQTADILQQLARSVSSSGRSVGNDASSVEMDVASCTNIVLGRGEVRRESSTEGSLVQALRCWQQWSALSGLAAKISESSIRGRVLIAAASVQTSTSPPAVLSQEETDQLVSFGLRPVGSADTDPSSYLDISLGVESLTSCSFLKTFADLRRLQLNVNKLRTLEGLETLCSLEELSVKDNALCNLSAIGNIRSLRTISADDNSINTEGLAALAGLSSLHTLSVNTNKLHVLPLLAGCSGLQRLHLYHNSISCLPSSSLAALCSLLHLDLGRNKLEFVCGAALSQCPLLQTLVLSQNQLAAAPSPLYLPNLRDLWLSGNRLCDLKSWMPHTNGQLPCGGRSLVSDTEEEQEQAAFDSVSEMQWPLFLPLLEKLHLSDNSLCEVSAAAVCNMPFLADLDLSFNGLISTQSLQGLCFLPKLSVLHLHDNPVYRSTGADTAASDLITWLVQRCPSLKMLSGNAVERRDNSSSNPTAAAGLATGATGGETPQTPSTSPPPASLQNTADVTRNRQDLLLEHRRTGRWVSPSPRCSMKSDRLPQLNLFIGDASCGIESHLPHTSSASFSRSQQLVQTLLTISFDQNVLKAREKVENVRPKYPSNTPVPFSEVPVSQTVDDNGLYWETACVKQLESHTAALMSWSWSADCPSSDLPVVWMSSRPILQVVEDDDVCDSTVLGDVEIAVDLVESGASTHVDLAAPVPAGVMRLQAVWRSRKVRTQLRRVMLAARYKDDELDELLGEDDFNLEEALGGYDEYLAPIALRGRWQTDPKPYSTSTSTSTSKAPKDPIENLHGVRLVKALAGGWLEGEIEVESESEGGGCDGEGSDQGSCSATPSCTGGAFVYGDHRRRRKSSVTMREGQLEPLVGKHAFNDGPESRPSDYSRSPQDRSFAFSQSLSADYAETFARSPSSARTELRPLDMSGRPNSVPDLLARHNGTRSSISPQEASQQGACQSAGAQVHRPKHHTVSDARRDADEFSEKNDLRIRSSKIIQTGGKGNQRLKSIPAARDTGDHEIDSDVRYQRLAKSASRGGAGAGSGGTTMSWGGGGAAGTSSSTGSGRGRGGRGKGGGRSRTGRKSLPPAWALSSRQEESDGGGGDESDDC